MTERHGLRRGVFVRPPLVALTGLFACALAAGGLADGAAAQAGPGDPAPDVSITDQLASCEPDLSLGFMFCQDSGGSPETGGSDELDGEGSADAFADESEDGSFEVAEGPAMEDNACIRPLYENWSGYCEGGAGKISCYVTEQPAFLHTVMAIAACINACAENSHHCGYEYVDTSNLNQRDIRDVFAGSMDDAWGAATFRTYSGEEQSCTFAVNRPGQAGNFECIW